MDVSEKLTDTITFREIRNRFKSRSTKRTEGVLFSIYYSIYGIKTRATRYVLYVFSSNYSFFMRTFKITLKVFFVYFSALHGGFFMATRRNVNSDEAS